MKVVSGADVRDFLSSHQRVYLCGDLTHPDIPSHCAARELEIGITVYPDYTAERPHVHTLNREYNLVVRGAVKVYIFSEEKEYLLREKDLFVIEPGTPYVSKGLADTEVVFVKTPGGNDKQLLEVTPAVERWRSGFEEAMTDGEEA